MKTKGADSKDDKVVDRVAVLNDEALCAVKDGKVESDIVVQPCVLELDEKSADDGDVIPVCCVSPMLGAVIDCHNGTKFEELDCQNELELDDELDDVERAADSDKSAERSLD